ncbi:hypothetical protein GMD4S_11371 [Streptococcus sp. GMD4S]|uniref:hypothetical protein n=1 Tax=unclassified Streptococcus TaxID=2608887 RepID=UPI000280DD4F|nr:MULTISPECIES: hypothetical protein [unclassified Streptococcus]EKA01404.1 hypothetical protein GMD6S_10465 [Streptococcus sp. GMD6S]EKA02745.1 hypothetical protein GMD4S_11371 [Streptococcus sp. GMD4S]EKA10119.1 hypothetical protein GMD2S_09519 [Streptococcus sp. GMD2S]
MNFDEKIPTEKIKQFFEDFVESIGEDIIRKHLKLQIRNANWSEEVDQISKYEQQIKWYQDQIKKIQEGKNDKNNDII